MTKKIRILDLCCGVGGCSIGYHEGFKRYGYEPIITGVDWIAQPNYPFKFIQNDALNYLRFFGHHYDVIHVSPPCQFYSSTASLHNNRYPDMIAKFRTLLRRFKALYIIENVEGAKAHMIDPIMICGLMVGLNMPRHRFFEVSEYVKQPIHPKHTLKAGKMGRRHIEGTYYPSPCGNFPDLELTKQVMGLHNAKKKKEVAQAIPPAYTSFLVNLLIQSSVLYSHVCSIKRENRGLMS